MRTVIFLCVIHAEICVNATPVVDSFATFQSSERIESLERDLAKASTATESQADNFSALEEKLQRASAAEEEAKNKIASLERELSSAKASSSQESLRLAEIQKELTRENQQVKELNEKLARLEATKAEQAKSTKSKTDARPVPPEEEGKLRRELSATKKQLEDAVMRMSDLEHQLKAAQDELKRALANEDRISRASADLEVRIARQAVQLLPLLLRVVERWGATQYPYYMEYHV